MPDEPKKTSRIDLRSYFPRFERYITWADGSEYAIRELDDLSESEEMSMIDDEERFDSMSHAERNAMIRRHICTLVVAPSAVRVTAPKGDKQLVVAGDGRLDYMPDDIVFVSSGLYVDRNVVESASEDGRSFTMRSPWLFGAVSDGRVFRSLRPSDTAYLTRGQLNATLRTVKMSDVPERDEGNPPMAASGSTS